VFGLSSIGRPLDVTASGFKILPVLGSLKVTPVRQPGLALTIDLPFILRLNSLCCWFPLTSAAFVTGLRVPLSTSFGVPLLAARDPVSLSPGCAPLRDMFRSVPRRKPTPTLSSAAGLTAALLKVLAATPRLVAAPAARLTIGLTSWPCALMWSGKAKSSASKIASDKDKRLFMA